MINIARLEEISRFYGLPVEDVLFIALNKSGVRYDCEYNRMRMAFHLDGHRFTYAQSRGELDYYFALPVNQSSDFVLTGDVLSLGEVVIGQAIGATEDICDSHYPRRNGTVLNLNPNARTSCSGCQFCYTAYQVPYDREKLKDACSLKNFFDSWLMTYGLADLSHLIQVAVVTGCYEDSYELCQFLITLRQVLAEYKFGGEIFYLGSQITAKDHLEMLESIKPFSICFSLETFERCDLLRDKKRLLTIEHAASLMDLAVGLGYKTTFSYIVGMEPLSVLAAHFSQLLVHINKFPIINTLQMHKYHKAELITPEAHDLEYFFKARQLLEQIFTDTAMRPLVWEDYRSLWYLTFNKEILDGIRTP